MVFALQQGRELDEKNDFERLGSRKLGLAKHSDIHPFLYRLLAKTFVRDLSWRFPSDKAGKIDPTGFTELIHNLDVCRRTLDLVRLEIAAWTTTGIVPTNNEDSFALLHSVESFRDDMWDSTLVFVAGGTEGDAASEVAAALAIQALRKNLSQQKPFHTTAGQSNLPADVKAAPTNNWQPLDIEYTKKQIMAALKDANKQVYAHSHSGGVSRIMGCTAEVVYVDGRNVVVGHVGDSRTYHFHEGRLIQLTRDQTQAIGVQPDVLPGLYHASLKPGDWIVVCSDGLINHVTNDKLREVLQIKAMSAEKAARR